MFEPSDSPRVFGVPLGVDFPAAVVEGLTARLAGAPPTALARVRIIVNTRRMQRRLIDIFDTGPARLLPRIDLVTDLAEWVRAPVPPEIPSLRRRLELAQAVALLIDKQPDLAARDAVFDLADSLARLIDEMQGEGVTAADIAALDVADMSGHWRRALSIIGIVAPIADLDTGLDREARQRWIVERLMRDWAKAPPDMPVILAGSTGSRGTTALLMRAVARLPLGAVLLPGFDGDMPRDLWATLDRAGVGDAPAEDHPQYRFRALMRDLDLMPEAIGRWTEARPHAPDRNRALSLALRPAPVTDAWMREGPMLTGLAEGFADVTLVEAPDPRREALAIALRLRQAAETGQRAALITPDRMLGRRVTAALDRWRIIPDDSAGEALDLTPPGRFLRHVAALFAKPLDGELLLTLLKHPLTHAGADRNVHLLLTRELELWLRKTGVPHPDARTLQDWAGTQARAEAVEWADWVGAYLTGKVRPGAYPLPDWVIRLRDAAEAIAAGPGGTAAHLWSGAAGEEAARLMDTLTAEAGAGGDMSALRFGDLLHALLREAEARNPVEPHPDIMIWGTLEARVQGADLLILAGLNEGTWPAGPPPDPWLNRTLRHQAGLLLPDRNIGLSAHDFQQAVAGREVWLTRAVRNDDAQTVPARWLNRLTNLLSGVPEAGGPEVLTAMRDRGATWIGQAGQLDAGGRIDPAPRPSPRPPVAARPRRLSVTEIQTLIRDPYAIYARRVLGLQPLDPLVPEPDALSRGVVLHDIMEAFIAHTLTHPSALDRDELLRVAHEVLQSHVPWPVARRLWAARVARFSDWFVTGEVERRARATPIALEERFEATLPEFDFVLRGQADRVDRADDGQLMLYDYKTGSPPTKNQQAHFDKQLLLEAAIAQGSGLGALPSAPVAEAVFIGLGAQKLEPAPLDDEPPDRVWAAFRDLIAAYMTPTLGFTARRMPRQDSDEGTYDHLARFGEWDRTTKPSPEGVG